MLGEQALGRNFTFHHVQIFEFFGLIYFNRPRSTCRPRRTEPFLRLPLAGFINADVKKAH